MSYSFTAFAPTRAELRSKVKTALDGIVAAQPIHAADREQAEAAANAFISLVIEDPEKDVTISMHGSVWSTPDGLKSAGVGVSVSQTTRAPLPSGC